MKKFSYEKVKKFLTNVITISNEYLNILNQVFPEKEYQEEIAR